MSEHSDSRAEGVGSATGTRFGSHIVAMLAPRLTLDDIRLPDGPIEASSSPFLEMEIAWRSGREDSPSDDDDPGPGQALAVTSAAIQLPTSIVPTAAAVDRWIMEHECRSAPQVIDVGRRSEGERVVPQAVTDEPARQEGWGVLCLLCSGLAVLIAALLTFSVRFRFEPLIEPLSIAVGGFTLITVIGFASRWLQPFLVGGPLKKLAIWSGLSALISFLLGRL